MEFRQHGKALNIVLQQLLAADDMDKYYPLWNALYEWGNTLMYCLGAIQLLRQTNQHRSNEEDDVFEETRLRLEYLIKEMRFGIGVEYSEKDSPANNPTTEAKDLSPS